jgi:hypothetical protein
MKSWLLLFVSSPLPENSSLPPGPIDVDVEEACALRSMLVLPIGLVGYGAPSKSGLVPQPTLSISVPFLSYRRAAFLSARKLEVWEYRKSGGVAPV